MKAPTLIAMITTVTLLTVFAGAQDSKPANPSLLKASFGKLPIYFIENRGVYLDEVKYYIKGADKTLFFTKDGITFQLKGKDRAWVVKLEFVGANPEVVPRGEDKQQAVFCYFKGPEKDWKTGLPTFSKVVYEDLWPGIDLVYRGTVNKLKYEFVVAPGADPSQIQLQYRGASSVTATDSGALRVETLEGLFEDAPPVAWQEIGGERKSVDLKFAVKATPKKDGVPFGFSVGQYDRTLPLILDPAILVYCGYIGGVQNDSGFAISVDGSGNVYVAGTTTSTETSFPVKVGPSLTQTGDRDAFVAKVNSQGTGLVYCGYIGGTGIDVGIALSVDSACNAYLAGYTWSTQTTFPVKVGPDLTHNGGESDAFVAKINSAGTGLVYCGFIGGNSGEVGYGISVDVGGNAYLSGYTASNEITFPVKVGPDLTYNGGHWDAFVTKVNAAGNGLVYCGYIGGNGRDFCLCTTLDMSGNVYVTGHTSSNHNTFPVMVGPDLTYNGGSYDAFVAKVNSAGSGLLYCGYIGGNASHDQGNAISIDPSGNAYVTGRTDSTETTFPVKIGPDLTHNGGTNNSDAFVAKVDAAGKGLVYCGYIGGDEDEGGNGISVDAFGNAYVTGNTASTETTFPVKIGPDLTHNGGLNNNDAFVAKVNFSGTGLVYCGYIGGDEDEGGSSISVDVAGNAYVAGSTGSAESSFPVKVGPDITYNGRSLDAFVAKVSLIHLVGSGTPRLGGTVNLTLIATDDVFRAYQAASSLGTGPILIGTRKIGLSLDSLLATSVWNTLPGLFENYSSFIGMSGNATAKIVIPNESLLLGVTIHSAFVTRELTAPSGIKSISNTFSFTIIK